jgi:hypothetical protein
MGPRPHPTRRRPAALRNESADAPQIIHEGAYSTAFRLSSCGRTDDADGDMTTGDYAGWEMAIGVVNLTGTLDNIDFLIV